MADADFLKQAPSEIFEPPKTEKSGVPPSVFSALHTGSVGRLPLSWWRNRNPNLPGLSVAHFFHWRSCAAQGFYVFTTESATYLQ